jgi:hypothetical protein
MIGALSRVDDRMLEVKESYLQLYRPDGSPQFSIRFPKARLDRFTRRLKSVDPVLVWTENFHLNGATMEVDTVSREAVFEGRVRMVIYQLGGVFPSVGAVGGEESPDLEAPSQTAGDTSAQAPKSPDKPIEPRKDAAGSEKAAQQN